MALWSIDPIVRCRFILISGNGVLVEAEGKQLGELHAGDFCGELAVLFRPGSFKDEQSGQPLKGHRYSHSRRAPPCRFSCR